MHCSAVKNEVIATGEWIQAAFRGLNVKRDICRCCMQPF